MLIKLLQIEKLFTMAEVNIKLGKIMTFLCILVGEVKDISSSLTL